jgi:hypothetical protein
MDIILPIIFQHARELAELQIALTEKERHKIITPFPPEGNEFLDFNKEDLEFGDPQSDSELAIRDTSKAHEYFLRTDNLMLDFSYAIPSEEYTLSRVCEKFYSQAIPKDSPDSAGFSESFSDKKGLFRKSKRITVGDLGQIEFLYTYYSPIQWSQQTLDGNDIARLQQKALDVYGSLGIQSPILDALVSDIKSISLCYSKLQYEFGFFDIVRDWVDPALFENNQWSFANDKDVLFGESNNSADEDNVHCMYATRLYVIRKYSGTPKEYSASQAGMDVRDHRPGGGAVISSTHKNLAPGTVIRDHRRP